MRFAQRLASLIILLGGAVVPSSVPASRSLTCQTVLVVGDSLAVGMGSEFFKLVANDHGNAILAGIVGTTTCQWRGKVLPLVEHHHPSLVLISLGTNDAAILAQDPTWLSRNESCYDDVQNEAMSHGSKVIWILPPRLPSKLEASRSKVVQQINRINSSNYDLHHIEVTRASDGIHTTPQGYATWATAVWTWWNE